ncbi:uncharacterized protein JCM6883_005136 [Sporobolomyces salmoneus]|uniref:uncharacterized protein n=1 Tax=Sporobolomyces salmoneus TaxID=183962 RepID=UPI00317A89F9
MSRRKHQRPSTPSSTRLPALLISFSSLLLSAGLASCLYVYTESLSDQLDGDVDQLGVVAWWTANAGLKWGLISSAGSLAGVVGILLHNASLHRVFAVSTFADLLLTTLLTFTLSLLTLTPSLSPTFGSFLCSSILSSSYDSPSTSSSRILHVERDGSDWPAAGGIDLLSWGVEACEESWKIGMGKVIVGCVVAVALRIYGVYVSWEHNTELREYETTGVMRGAAGGDNDCWVDDEGVPSPRRRRNSSEMRQLGGKEELRRSRSRSSFDLPSASSTRRSNTLPATGLPPRYSDPSASRPRSQSSSTASSNRPRLVLLPVYVDRHGNPIGSPTNSPSSPPAYRSRSSTSPHSHSKSYSQSKSPSSPSTLRPPPPPRKRSYSVNASIVPPPSKRSPSLSPLPYTEEPLSISPPSSSGSTTPTCTSNSATERGGKLSPSSKTTSTRRSRHRSETDAGISSAISPKLIDHSPLPPSVMV